MNNLTNKNVTLDKKHTDMLNEFKYNEEILIPKYNIEIVRLEKFLKNSKNKKKKEKIEKKENKKRK